MPFFFDLDNRGAVGDKEAKKFVVAARKELGGQGVPTPPVLFMNADGKMLGEIDNYASPDVVLKAMRRVLKENPDCDRPSEAEEKAAGIEKAEILVDLLDFDGARAVLEKEKGSKVAYLLGHLARLDKKWDEMEKRFGDVTDAALADDVRMERAHRRWQERDFKELAAALKDFPADSNRYTEARYYEGLASHHLEADEAALKIWKDMIKSKPQDAWIYRADWAWYGIKYPDKGDFSSEEQGSTPLGRIGYMGGTNPDLKGPR